MEPNAYHNAEDLNNDDDASMYGHRDSVMVELRIDVFQDVKAMKGAQSGLRSVENHWKGDQDRETSLILETRWYHVGQIRAENDKDNEKHIG